METFNDVIMTALQTIITVTVPLISALIVYGIKKATNWLKSKNVDTLITSHMGEKPFSTLLQNNINVYFAGDERIELKDVMIKYADGELSLLNNENFQILIKEDDEHHSNSCCSKESEKIHNHNHNMENKLQKAPYKSFIRNIHF